MQNLVAITDKLRQDVSQEILTLQHQQRDTAKSLKDTQTSVTGIEQGLAALSQQSQGMEQRLLDAIAGAASTPKPPPPRKKQAQA